MQNRRADPVDKLSVLATITGALPTPANPVPDGGVLSYRYGYDGDGNMTSATRSIASAPDRLESSEGSKAAATPVTVKKSTASFSYDPLDRLTGSTSSTGMTRPATVRVGHDRVRRMGTSPRRLCSTMRTS